MTASSRSTVSLVFAAYNSAAIDEKRERAVVANEAVGVDESYNSSMVASRDDNVGSDETDGSIDSGVSDPDMIGGFTDFESVGSVR
jgi:hypothetical protein